MFELLTIAIFIWLMVKAIGLTFPVLIVCFIFVVGILKLVYLYRTAKTFREYPVGV